VSAGEKRQKIKRERVLYLSLVFLILVFSLLSRLYWGIEKEGLHVDEVLSVMMANHNNLNPDISANIEYRKEDIEERLFINDASINDTAKDVSSLYLQNVDSPHTNFYYSLLRLSFIGRKALSLKDIIYTGLFLNAVIFTVGFVFLYKLLTVLFEDKLLVLLGLFCGSVSSGVISNSLFLRPYQLQSTMLLIFSYVIVTTIVNSAFTKKNFFMIVFASTGALLSGYFSIVYVALFSLLVFLKYIFSSARSRIFYFGAGILAGTIITELFYPKYWQTLLAGTDRSGEAYSKVSVNYILSSVGPMTKQLYGFINSYVVYGVLVLLAFIIGFLLVIKLSSRKKIVFNYLALAIVAISLIFSLCILIIAPYKVVRYIAPVFPLLAIFLPTVVETMGKNRIRYIVSILIFFIYTVAAFNAKDIKYLYHNKLGETSFLAYNNSKVCITSPYSFRFLEWLPYANSDKVYSIFKDLMFSPDTVFGLEKSGCGFVVVDTLYGINNYEAALNEKFSIKDKLITPGDDVSGFIVYRVESKR
jgi:hypothetical protein